jgi:hypothetical protein
MEIKKSVRGRLGTYRRKLFDGRTAEYKAKARLPDGGHMRLAFLVNRLEPDPATAFAAEEILAETIIGKLSELKLQVADHYHRFLPPSGLNLTPEELAQNLIGPELRCFDHETLGRRRLLEFRVRNTGEMERSQNDPSIEQTRWLGIQFGVWLDEAGNVAGWYY